MTTLPAFLLARLAEDEDAAEHVNRGLWNSRVAMLDPDLYGHIARHDPARVLTDVAAKRAIVELHEGFVPIGTLSGRRKCETCAENVEADYDGARMVEWPCPTLRHLASVYRDHPEFDEGWAL